MRLFLNVKRIHTHIVQLVFILLSFEYLRENLHPETSLSISHFLIFVVHHVLVDELTKVFFHIKMI